MTTTPDNPDSLTPEELGRWLMAWMADPSILHPRELGYDADGVRRPRRENTASLTRREASGT